MQLAYIMTAEHHLCKRIILPNCVQQRSKDIFVIVLMFPQKIQQIEEILRTARVLQRLLLFR